ncbi:hypothetical protein EDB86DRAFT_2829008 [Lactarius hatsudake]|nr:hypothetical protein EDB86DRAFT_2829008 [Lactarius hatsudake]
MGFVLRDRCATAQFCRRASLQVGGGVKRNYAAGAYDRLSENRTYVRKSLPVLATDRELEQVETNLGLTNAITESFVAFLKKFVKQIEARTHGSDNAIGPRSTAARHVIWFNTHTPPHQQTGGRLNPGDSYDRSEPLDDAAAGLSRGIGKVTATTAEVQYLALPRLTPRCIRLRSSTPTMVHRDLSMAAGAVSEMSKEILAEEDPSRSSAEEQNHLKASPGGNK